MLDFDKLQKMSNILYERKDPFDFENFFGVFFNMSSRTAAFFKKEVKKPKDRQKSTLLRREGTKVFVSCGNQTEALIKALETYTKCIMFAPVDSQEIALGYANRSAVLLKLNRPVECLEDISRAKKSNYPDYLLAKLLQREGDCYKKLIIDCHMEAKYWLNKVSQKNATTCQAKLKNYPAKPYINFIEKEQLIVPEIKTANEKFPCASAAIDVKYSNSFGRHIVATRDIEPGEVLIVERPYCKFLETKLNHSHCNNCMINVWNGIPCEHCVNVIFCSEECKGDKTVGAYAPSRAELRPSRAVFHAFHGRKISSASARRSSPNVRKRPLSCHPKADAWAKYHQFTCTLFDSQQEKYFPKLSGALKLLFELVHEAGGVQELKKRIENLQIKSDKPVWPLKDQWYKKGSLESIVTLLTRVNKVERDDLTNGNGDSIQAVYALAAMTDFFGSKYNSPSMSVGSVLSSMSKDSDVKFIGGLLIKLALIVHHNKENFEESLSNRISCFKGYPGTALMPLLSLMNLNCFSNTMRQYKKDHVVVYARCPIKKGEQIFKASELNYMILPKNARQRAYQSKYYFTCSCVACLEDWPQFKYRGAIGLTLALKYSLKREFDNEWTRREVDALFQRCEFLSSRPLIHDLEDKDKILMEYYNALKFIYERVVLPCDLISSIHGMIDIIIFNCMGNVSLGRLVDMHSDAKEVTYDMLHNDVKFFR